MSVFPNRKPTARDVQRQDALFEQFLLDAEHQVVETDLTPSKRRDRRREADADDLAFCRIYYPQIFDQPFNDLHRHIASLETGNHTISGFRKSGKSATVYVGKVVKHIALGGRGMVGIGMRTIRNTEARTSALSRIIQKNHVLCYDYGIEIMQDQAAYFGAK